MRDLSKKMKSAFSLRRTIVAPDGELFTERMIPVRVAATRAQIEEIIDFTLVYYDQLAVMAYRVGDEVILKERTP